ncbi:MAG: hypothetical protein IKA76_06575 [Clostridia bacterium]|nr:hypothetical protein [Clostridia bacterium]
MKKRIGTMMLLIGILFMLSIPVSAKESEDMIRLPDGFSDAAEALPDESRNWLPDGFFSKNPEEAGQAVMDLVEVEYLFDAVFKMIGIELSGAVKLLATLSGLLILSAVFGAVQSSISSDRLSTVFGFCSTAAIFSAVASLQLNQMKGVSLFFERLGALMSSMIPVMGSLWAMGGNVATAASGTGTLYVFLAVCQRVCAVSVLPVCGVMTVLALCNALSPEVGVRGIAGALKKIYTFSLGTVMTLLLASLSGGSALTAAADSTAARAAKLATSTAIPIVGGSVGETLRTLSAGVQYMKEIVGIGGVILLGILSLPVLISLILTRLVFLLSVGVAELLGCDREAKLLSELGSAWGIMIAVVAMSTVLFVLALVLFIKTVVAVG